MVFSRRPIQWKGHSRLTRARCFLGKQSSPLPTAAEHEVVEAPLATKEDDIPNETHHAFQSTIKVAQWKNGFIKKKLTLQQICILFSCHFCLPFKELSFSVFQ